MIFIGAVFRSKSGQRIVTGIITALFAITVAQLGVNWYFTYLCFLRAGESRLHIFYESLQPPDAYICQVMIVILQGLGQIFADALLVNSLLLPSDTTGLKRVD